MTYSGNSFLDDFAGRHYLEIAVLVLDSVLRSAPWMTDSYTAGWLRVVISKSYYASFLELRNAFRAVPALGWVVSKRANVHTAIGNCLDDNLPEPLCKFATDLGDLRKARNHADYDMPGTFNLDIDLAASSVKKSRGIISNLDRIMDYLVAHPPKREGGRHGKGGGAPHS